MSAPSLPHERRTRTPTFLPSSVLLATDFSDSAAGAMEVAIVLARQFGASLFLLHVFAAPNPARVGTRVDVPAPGTAMPTSAEQLESVHTRLREMLARCHEQAVSAHAEVMPLSGSTAQVINAQAARTGADLIVVGTHGRTGFGRAVLGSVAEGVTRTANVPVVVVPTGTVP